jgi:hypothetical protein
MIFFAIKSRIHAIKLFEILLHDCNFFYCFYIEFENARLCLKVKSYVSAIEMIIEHG